MRSECYEVFLDGMLDLEASKNLEPWPLESESCGRGRLECLSAHPWRQGLWEWLECLTLTSPQVDDKADWQMDHCDGQETRESMPSLFHDLLEMQVIS